MATFDFNNVTYTCVYIDTSNPVNGSGVDTSSPLNVFPAISALATNTCYIVRRVAPFTSVPWNNSNSQNNIIIIGSPKTSDSLYSLIPESSVWQSDIESTHTIWVTGNPAINQNGINFTGNNIRIERINILQKTPTASITYNYSVLNMAGTNTVLSSTTLNISAMSYESLTFSSYECGGVRINPDKSLIDNCQFNANNRNTFDFITTGTGRDFIMNNTTLKSWGNSGYVINIGVGITNSEFVFNNCTILSNTDNSYSVFINNLSTSVLKFFNCNFNLQRKTSSSGVLYGFYFGSACVISFYNCIIDYNPNSSSNLSILCYANGCVVIFQNTTFQNSFAPGTGGTLITNSTDVSYIGCTFNIESGIGANSVDNGIKTFTGNTYIKGGLSVNTPIYLSTYVPASGGNMWAAGMSMISRGDNGLLYIGSATLNNATYKNLSLNENGMIFIDNCDINLDGRITYGTEKNAVYVKNEKGNIVKVNFGDPNMRIKKSNPERRKSFRH